MSSKKVDLESEREGEPGEKKERSARAFFLHREGLQLFDSLEQSRQEVEPQEFPSQASRRTAFKPPKSVEQTGFKEKELKLTFFLLLPYAFPSPYKTQRERIHEYGQDSQVDICVDFYDLESRGRARCQLFFLVVDAFAAPATSANLESTVWSRANCRCRVRVFHLRYWAVLVAKGGENLLARGSMLDVGGETSDVVLLPFPFSLLDFFARMLHN